MLEGLGTLAELCSRLVHDVARQVHQAMVRVSAVARFVAEVVHHRLAISDKRADGRGRSELLKRI
eukprot:7389115-Prymnesium_polylepis.1